MSTKTSKRKRASARVTAAAPAPPSAPLRSDAGPSAVPTDVAAELSGSLSVASAEAPERPSAIDTATLGGSPSATGAAAPERPMPTIDLSSNCTVKDAAGLKNELVQWLDEPGSVAIDAKSVERIDTATVQLLCAFVRDRAERNLGVTWAGTPQPLLDAARLLGVRALLALPTEAAP